MTLPICPTCLSRAISIQMPDSPEVLPLKCRRCGHEWEIYADRLPADALVRLAPLPHWRLFHRCLLDNR
jgi:hypothetical protein